MKLITWNVQRCCGLNGRVDLVRIAQGARERADSDLPCLQALAAGDPERPGDAVLSGSDRST